MSPPVTLITGTRKGLGRWLAEHYVRAGHAVLGCSREEADWSLDGYRHFRADVTDEAAVGTMVAGIADLHGRVDNLINNAGVAAMNHALLTPMSSVRGMLETNVAGTFLVTREVARVMSRRRYGRIVNVGSVAVPLHLEGEAAYVASKAAVTGLAEVLARDLGPFGITVNVVAPTLLETDLTRRLPARARERLLERQAIRRPGQLDDVAHAVDFFLDPRSSFVTGQTLFLGGIS